MKKYIGLIGLSLWIGSVYGQVPTVSVDTMIANKLMSEAIQMHTNGKYSDAYILLDSAKQIFQNTVGYTSEEIVETLFQMGRSLRKSGKTEEAIKKYEEALAICDKIYPHENLYVANLNHNLGIAYTYLRKWDTAIDYLNKGISIRLNFLGPKHPDILGSLNALWKAYYEKGDAQKSVDCLEAARLILEESAQKDSLELKRYYHNLGVSYDDLSQYDKAIQYYRLSLSMFPSSSPLKTRTLDSASCYENIGVSYLKKADFNQSLAFSQAALQMRIRALGTENLSVADSYANIGSILKEMADYEGALFYQESALALRLKSAADNQADIASSYHNIGNIYLIKGEYNKAIEFYHYALGIKISLYGPENVRTSSTYTSLANAYNQKNEQLKAINFYNKSLKIRKDAVGEQSTDVATLYNNLGLSYLDLPDTVNAKKFLFQALEIRKNILDEQHPDIADSYFNIGSFYKRKKDYENALIYYKKSEEIYLKRTSKDSRDIALIYNNFGYIYFCKGNLIESENYFIKSLEYNKYFKGNFEYVKDFDALITSLQNIGATYRDHWKNSRNIQDLQTSFMFSEEAIHAFDYYDNFLKLSADKEALRKRRYTSYENLVANSLTLSEIQNNADQARKTLQYAEISKANLLQSQIKALNALNFSGIPKDMLLQEHDLRVGITWREKKRQNLLQVGGGETDNTILQLSSQIFDLHQQYDQLIRRFETEYPEYYRAKHDLRTETVETIQRDLLQPGQTMLEYFTGDSSIFIFVLRKDLYEIVEVPRDFPLEDWVQSMRSGIADWWVGKIPEDQYAASLSWYGHAAYDLYQKLVAPVARFIPAGDQIIVIPDGILAYVPFEALLTAPAPADLTRFHEYKYWVLDHDISYCYSATLLREMRERKHKTAPKCDFLGIAPTFAGSTTSIPSSYLNFEGRFGHESLKYNIMEVDSIQHILGGQIFTGGDATEKCFFDTAWAFRIIHASLHGESNDHSGDYSFLVFYETPDSVENEWLYVREVYNLALNADLVTLSACQTGLGELRRGEGIIGLTRAFTYAGAKSIVNTLWSIDDKRTMLLMTQFYRNLKTGQEKDAALGNAKRESIRKGELWAHPVFWAGFIAIGDMRPIN